MTSYQESYEKMSVTSVAFLSANAAITATLPNFPAYFTVIQTTNSQIQSALVQQEADKSGDTNAKRQLRATLIAQAIDVARRVVAYATNTNNSALLALVDYTESDLKKASDQRLVNSCQVIRDNANANIAALASYGITAAVLTTLQTSITSFSNTIPKGRIDTTDGGEVTKLLTTLFKTLSANWKKIDILVEMVRTSQPNFYNEYQKVRKVIDTGTGSLAVKGLVTDAGTGEPVKGATVSFSLDGAAVKTSAAAAKPVLVKKTAVKGGFNIKTLPEGIYNVSVKKNGYVEQVVSIAISNGEKSEFKIELSKS